MQFDQVIATLRAHQSQLAEKGVGAVSIFGSTARGEATSQSDLDILVELNRPMGLFEFIGIKFYLEELLGTQVDLVTEPGLHPALRESILAEAIRVA